MTWKYTPGSGSWTQTSKDTSRPKSTSSSASASVSALNKAPAQIPEPSESGTSDGQKTKAAANKQIEINVLEGDLTLTIPVTNIKEGDTLFLTGLGKNLTGLYLVESVTDTIESRGWTQKVKVTKSGFGASLKKGNVTNGLGDWWNSSENGRPKKIISNIKYE